MGARGAAVALVVALGALVGCGLGPGDELTGGAVELRVTRDFGRSLLSSAVRETVREDETVLRLLRGERDIDTRFGGRFVQTIDGVSGGGPSGGEDWFFYVNGIEADRGAAEYELTPGDVVQWDFRDWGETQDVRAIVGAYPEPFVNGLEGKRFPVRVECEDSQSEPCGLVKERLRDAGAQATGAALGAPGTQQVARVVVADWETARELPSARLIELGPRRSGVFARFIDEGERLELLDEAGRVARTAGAGSGLVAALRPTDKEILWVVTGTDQAGVAAAAQAFDRRSLRDAFAIAVLPGSGPENVPLEEAP